MFWKRLIMNEVEVFYLFYIVNSVLNVFLVYVIIMLNIVIVYVIRKMLLFLVFFKILLFSFVVFDFCVGFVV